MQTRSVHVSTVLALIFLACAVGRETAQPSKAAAKDSDRVPLKKVADIPMPGPAVRFDYQSLDPSQERLYIAHMNADQLVVFDTKKREVVANLDGFRRVHGVWAVPELDRVYASVTGEHKVAAVDMKTLQTVAEVGTINYPDGIAYAPGPQRIFVSDEHGNVDAVIDTKSNSLLASIPAWRRCREHGLRFWFQPHFGRGAREKRSGGNRSGDHADHWPLPHDRR